MLKQFGQQIENVMRQTLNDFQIRDIKIIANDQGALDYTIRARLETAIKGLFRKGGKLWLD